MPKKSDAAELQRLQAEVDEARAERDQAITDLAQVKAELAALRLLMARPEEAEPPSYPQAIGTAPVPLRYRVADELNERLKGALGPLYGLGRGLFGKP